MSGKRMLVLATVLAGLLCAAGAEEMRISLIRGSMVMDVYEGEGLRSVSSALRNARRISVEEVYLCPQASEGTYRVTVTDGAGIATDYLVSDDFQACASDAAGNGYWVSCSLLCDLRGVLIAYLLGGAENAR